MKGFWKWFLIVLGALLLIAVAFGITMFLLRGGMHNSLYNRGFNTPGGMMGRRGAFGGMMAGMGLLMFFRFLFPLGILVLAGFGVAYLVRGNNHRAVIAPLALTCQNCGKPLAAEWKVCPHCGTAVPTEEAAPTNASATVVEKKSSTKKSSQA
jgi:hypothetical protein